jgi:hypothetical protein
VSRFPALLILTVCACTSSPRALVPEYLNSVYELGLTPIYPPREEFQVGDVFLVAQSSDAKFDPKDSSAIWVGTYTPAVAAAEETLKTRIVFQQTNVGTSQDSTELDQEDLFGAGISTRADQAVRGLPVSGFPEITADAGLTAGLGLNGLLQRLGLLNSKRTVVRLNFQDVRSIWVENAFLNNRDMNDFIVETAASADADTALTDLCLEALRNRNLGLPGDLLKSKDPSLSAAIITRVYLTRTISYTYYNAEIAAGGLLQQSRAGGGQVNAPQVVINIPTNTSPPDSMSSEINDATEGITSALNSSGQGAGLQFVSWNALGLTFKQTFPRPVAIAYKSYSVALGTEKEDGKFFRFDNPDLVEDPLTCADFVKF